MPNTKSAKKRAKVIVAKTLRNKVVKSALKTTLKKTNAAIVSGGDTAEALKAAYKAIDKASAKGVIHKNTAARKKSKLAKLANSAPAAQ